MLQPVDTTTLQTRVYTSLRENIMEGRFHPGDTFTIRSLATAMGTSVMPVREALSRLLAEGAVEMHLPSRHMAIPIMSRDEVIDLYRIRMMLEGCAAARAAREISSEEIEAAAEALLHIDNAIAAEDQTAFLAANRTFHFTVYRAARSPLLLPMIEMLWLRTGPLLRVPTHPTSRLASRLMEGGQEHHHTLMAGLRAADPDLARRGLEHDLRDAMAWFERNYDPGLFEAAAQGGRA